MNYEQKYHEALERAKKMRDSIIGSHNPESAKLHVGHIENIFPELAESEDERIRKSLLAYIKGESKRLDTKNWIAYLEKLKERGPLTNEEEYTLHRIIEYLEDETCPSEWISLLHDIYCLPYERKKEQKPVQFKNNKLVDIIKGEFEGFRTLLKKKGIDYEPQRIYWEGFARLFDSSAREYVREQKPAKWSEEDESILRLIHEALSCAYSVKNMDAQTCSVMREWLNNRVKSLRPQPKQEWSDGNKQWFDAIIKDYEDSLSGDEDHDPAIQIKINLLKSIRLKSLRPSWKPSEEQMAALAEALARLTSQDMDNRIYANLCELKSDLKKLM